MKTRLLTKLLYLFVITLSLSFLVGCSNISEERIRKDYLEMMHEKGEVQMGLEDVIIIYNYGTYNGSVVVRIERNAFPVITEIEVVGVKFTFFNSNTALVWNNGEFYELEEAYDKKLLTISNLEAIAAKVNKSNIK